MLPGDRGKAPLWRPLAATLGLVLTMGAWQLFATWNERAHLSAAVVEALQAQGWADVVVVVDFPPEKFHLLFLQDRGRVIRVDGPVVHMQAVPAADVRRIARQYWISAVRPGGR